MPRRNQAAVAFGVGLVAMVIGLQTLHAEEPPVIPLACWLPLLAITGIGAHDVAGILLAVIQFPLLAALFWIALQRWPVTRIVPVLALAYSIAAALGYIFSTLRRMNIEAVQERIGAVISLFPILTPCLLVSAILCGVFRHSRWISPIWVFSICPVLIIFGLLVHLMIRTSRGFGPDWGFVAMGTGFILLLSLAEVIPGVLLLAFYPRRSAWEIRMLLPSVLAGMVSLAGCMVLFSRLPIRH